MKCPECAQSGKQSTVSPGISYQAPLKLPPATDPRVIYALPANAIYTRYTCSQGHDFEIARAAGVQPVRLVQ